MGCNAEEWITQIAAREEQLDRLTTRFGQNQQLQILNARFGQQQSPNEVVGWFTTASWMLVPKSAYRSVRGRISVITIRDPKPYIQLGEIDR